MSKALFVVSDLVSFSDGSIDEESSLALFSEKVRAHIESEKYDETEIENVVHAIFDDYRGAGCSLDYIESQAVVRLRPGKEFHAQFVSRVKRYMQNNMDKVSDKRTGAVGEEPRTRLFSCGRGRSGGIRRWSDVPVEEEKGNKKKQ